MTLDLAKDFRYDTQDHEQQNNKKKKDFIKIKNFCAPKNTSKKVKR